MELFVDEYAHPDPCYSFYSLTKYHGCSLASILTCHFMISLRQFDSVITSATYSGMGSGVREHAASAVLEFRSQHSDSLPALIASFAHPVHVNTDLYEMDPDKIVDVGLEGQGMDLFSAPGPGSQSHPSPTAEPTTQSAELVGPSV